MKDIPYFEMFILSALFIIAAIIAQAFWADAKDKLDPYSRVGNNTKLSWKESEYVQKIGVIAAYVFLLSTIIATSLLGCAFIVVGLNVNKPLFVTLEVLSFFSSLILPWQHIEE